MAFFAIYGAIALFGRKSNLNIFRKNIFIQAFCVASLFAFALEATLFNFPHYLRPFAGDEFHTVGVSPHDSTVILTSDSSVAGEIFFEKKAVAASDSVVGLISDSNISSGTSLKENDSATIFGGVVFKNINRKITSVFIEPIFDTAETIVMMIRGVDETGKIGVNKTVCKGLPHTYHVPLQFCGNISELKITLAGANTAGASRITINRRIPMYFSGLRLLVVSALFFVIISFAYRQLRVKAAYFLFDYRFDPSNKKQNIVYVSLIVSLILFSWLCAYTSVTENAPQARQYNKYLVDAFIAGRVNLETGNLEKMQNLEKTQKTENIYNLRWLEENGYKRDIDWFGDWVYYKGKYYCYFGAVPALMLYVPYKLITGNYLSNHGGIFIFAAISIILLARLWKFFVKKYMPDVRFAFFLLSFLTLFFASGWFCPLRFTRFYSIVSAAGFMFVIAGVLLLFESVEREQEKPNRLKLFFACLCLALAVGCRPNLIFVSLVVPVILWKHRLWKYLPLIAVPYVMTAIPLCVYNYVRFGSILDFGFNYNMTNLNAMTYNLLNPIGKIINTLVAALSYLFFANKYSLFFPYIESIRQHDNFFWAIVRFYDKGYGMINFPIVLCLLFFFKNIFAKANRPKTFYISCAFLSIAAVLILANSWLAGFSGRYAFDFAVFIILPSLFCAYHWCNGGEGVDIQTLEYQIRVRHKVTYVLLTFSILVGVFLFATTVTNDSTPDNAAVYLYLRQSLIFLGIV